MFKNLFGKSEEKPLEVDQDWGNYFCHVESKPASIRLNLALKHLAPIDKYVYRIWFSVLLLNPDENGFTTREEFSTICQIEDDLWDVLQPKGAIMAGTLKTDGTFDMYCYVQNNEDYELLINKVMQKYPNYKYATETEEDSEWSTYFNFLYPSDYEYQAIQNQRVIMNLDKHGNNSEKERKVDHWLYFASEDGRELFIKEVEAIGYQVSGKENLDEKENPYQLHIVRSDNTVWQNVNEYVWELITLAEPHNGIYDGWGCTIES